jgi:NADPH:quinone reductase-like Zn-dependent oxidoreductase
VFVSSAATSTLQAKEAVMPRNVVLHTVGGPDVLTIEQFAPVEPGPGEVRIVVRAIGLNRAEAMFRSGTYLEYPQFPARLGYEASGVIDAVGPGVVGLHQGDAVSDVPSFSFSDYGLYGESVLAPARAVVLNPPSLSFEEAAALWMAFATAWCGLVDIANVGRGDTVLLLAASSSVGLAAIQVVRALGAIPIAITRTRAKAAQLEVAGAAHVIVTNEQRIDIEVDRITGGEGARVAFDPVGGPDFPLLVTATKRQGVIVVYGALSEEVTPLPMLDVLGRELSIRGFALSNVMDDDTKLAAVKRFVFDGAVQGLFTPVIAEIFEFEDIRRAHAVMEENRHFGKLVVRVGHG